MRSRPASRIATIVSGVLLGADRLVREVVIDSRNVRAGSLFVALGGERTNGHRFVRDALSRGAAAGLVARGVSSDRPAIVVEDPGAALIELARHERGAMDARVVGITGSVGKTTTKDLASAILRSRFRVAASPRSFNNEIGVPLTVLGAPQHTEVLVSEIGAGAVGEIARLCAVARPHIGIVTAVGPAHLETFGSLERIATAKAELVEALPADGLAILNADDPVVATFGRRTRARVLRYGRGADADVRARDVRLDAQAHARFTLEHGDDREPVRLRLVGEHFVSAALAAAAAGIALGVPIRACAEALERTDAAPGRMQDLTTPEGVRILHDAYNANPTSTLAGLRALVAAGDGGRAIAVLGPMAQLGPSSVREHERIGRAAATLGVDVVIVIGEASRGVAEGAVGAGMPRGRVHRCGDRDEAVEVLLGTVRATDVVLVKASRDARLDELVAALGPARPTGVPA